MLFLALRWAAQHCSYDFRQLRPWVHHHTQWFYLARSMDTQLKGLRCVLCPSWWVQSDLRSTSTVSDDSPVALEGHPFLKVQADQGIQEVRPYLAAPAHPTTKTTLRVQQRTSNTHSVKLLVYCNIITMQLLSNESNRETCNYNTTKHTEVLSSVVNCRNDA